MDVRMAAALAQGVDDVAAFCRAQGISWQTYYEGISRQTYYEWKRRFERAGLDGFARWHRATELDPERDPGRHRGGDRAGPQRTRRRRRVQRAVQHR